jgi:TolB-like protein/tetratricopeptide (TPR) repeat protein/predicted Ser/Thr protein kinase
MDPARWQIVKDVFHAALLQDATERTAYLQRVVADDASLRAEIAAMIAAEEKGGTSIESRIAEVASELLEDDPARSPAGSQVGNHRILSALGAGGMGEVYLAEDTRLGRKVALKVLASHLPADVQSTARLRREARVASALDHPNICTIYEVGAAAGRSFISMQYVEGDTVQRLLEEGPLKVDRLLSVALQVAEAMRAAHAHGIIHRDIKPSNIMVTSRGEVKVLDFGVAKLLGPDSSGLEPELTSSGTMVGTPAYLSPEQAGGVPVDRRSDIFSLGIVLYEMATGRVPFTGSSATDVMHAIIHEPHPTVRVADAEIPAGLATVIDRALRKAPAERYQSAEEMIAALRAVTESIDASADHIAHDAQVDALARSSSRVAKAIPAWLRRSERPAWRVGLGVGLIALIGVIAGIVGRPVRSTAIDSVAVLPFTHAGGDLEHLGDGLAESITGQLSQLSQLRVIARSTMFSYKGRNLDPGTIGRELGVRTVLTGQLVQQGDVLVVRLELVDVQDGSRIWGDQYSRPFSQIFALPGELAVDVSRRLRPRLGSEEKQLLTRNYTQDPQAYQLYVRGRYFFNKVTVEGAERAIGYFQQAIERDPTYALAYAGLADSYLMLRGYGIRPVEETVPKARAAALRAVQLDPDVAETYVTLGLLKMRTRAWADAAADYRRAIELNPNSARGHHLYAMQLVGLGRYSDAFEQLRRALDLDPLSLPINTDAGRIFYFTRRYDDAIASYRKTLEIDENFAMVHLHLGEAYEMKQMYAEAIAEYRKAQSLGGRIPAARIGRAYALWGKTAQAREILDEFEETSKTGFVPYFGMTVLYAGMGQNEKALAWLERQLEAGVGDLFLKVDPVYDSLRSEPKFRLLQQRAGFY